MKTVRIGRRDPVEQSRISCRKKFLYYFPAGFRDATYISWERDYKLSAHRNWKQALNRETFMQMLEAGAYMDIAQAAVKIETRTNLLFSFEKMALRDALKTNAAAKIFATALYNYLYGSNTLRERFENFSHAVASLPRIQTRVHTWPLVTVFGFLGNPKEHIFLKPRVTKAAAEKYQFPFEYRSKPAWDTYASLQAFASLIKKDVSDLKPADMIDLQSFIWVLGSEEYPD
jgi:hypothetical protein